jgi:hypothetical protein
MPDDPSKNYMPYAKAVRGKFLPGGVQRWRGTPQPTRQQAQDLLDAYLDKVPEGTVSGSSIIEVDAPPPVEFPQRIPGVNHTLETYFPDIRGKMEDYGAAQFLTGLDAGLAVTEKLINWLTMKPAIKPAKLREYVMAEHAAIVAKHWHLLQRVDIPPAIRALIPDEPPGAKKEVPARGQG